jgi:hypothetical protein
MFPRISITVSILNARVERAISIESDEAIRTLWLMKILLKTHFPYRPMMTYSMKYLFFVLFSGSRLIS